MNRTELLAKIVEWAHARNIIKGTTAFDQWVKGASEVGELADGLAKKQPEMIKDAIGDVVVMLAVMCSQLGVNTEFIREIPIPSAKNSKESFQYMFENFGQLGYSIRVENHSAAPYVTQVTGRLAHIAKQEGLALLECIAFAYDQIKDRKGVVFNGTFIKSNDVRYQSALAELGLSE